MDKSEYFSRQIKLWGMERQSNLENRRVLIVGAGGLGSSLAYALGTSGIGEIECEILISYHYQIYIGR